MDLDRGKLARIDRKLLAGMGQDETFQMVRVPATAAMWATWKRYCNAAGMSMGRAIMLLIERELLSVFGESTGDEVPILAGRAQEELAAREAQIGARAREVSGYTDGRTNSGSGRSEPSRLPSRLLAPRWPVRRLAAAINARVGRG